MTLNLCFCITWEDYNWKGICMCESCPKDALDHAIHQGIQHNMLPSSGFFFKTLLARIAVKSPDSYNTLQVHHLSLQI